MTDHFEKPDMSIGDALDDANLDADAEAVIGYLIADNSGP